MATVPDLSGNNKTLDAHIDNVVRPNSNVSPPVYLGQVATRSMLNDDFMPPGSAQYCNGRTPHIARDNITQLQAEWGNWYVSANPGFAETNAPGTALISMGIEYPVGVFTPMKVNGAASFSCGSGANVLTDKLNIVIPYGAQFWFRMYLYNALGFPYVAGFTADQRADQWEMGLGVGTDKSLGGAIAVANWVWGCYPLALIANTTRVAAGVYGDSRFSGGKDLVDDTSFDQGEAARSLGPFYAYANLATKGDYASKFLVSNAKRLYLQKYYSHIFTDYGNNDILVAGRAAAAVATDMAAIAALFPGKPVFGVTAYPYGLSGTYADLVGQTINAAVNTQRVALNGMVRAGLPGYRGFFDIADAIESSRNSGKFAPASLTDDGTHLNNAGMTQLRRYNAIPPGMFTR